MAAWASRAIRQLYRQDDDHEKLNSWFVACLAARRQLAYVYAYLIGLRYLNFKLAGWLASLAN